MRIYVLLTTSVRKHSTAGTTSSLGLFQFGTQECLSLRQTQTFLTRNISLESDHNWKRITARMMNQLREPLTLQYCSNSTNHAYRIALNSSATTISRNVFLSLESTVKMFTAADNSMQFRKIVQKGNTLLAFIGKR